AQALGRGEPVDPIRTPLDEVNAVSEGMHAAAEELSLRSADLRASESRLRLSVQATGIGIWDVDIPNRRRTWSAEFLRIVGCPPGTPAERNLFAERIHPADREWVTENYNQFFRARNGDDYRAEFRIRHAQTGEERWVITSGRLARDGNGVPVRASGTLMDVTERRRVETSLRESEKRFRSMADSVPALIWMTDADGQIVFLNKYHERVYGRSVEDLLRSDWRDILVAEDYDEFMKSFTAGVGDNRPWHDVVRVRDV